ncbi:unannotated protein [freshwater metagenome]|uniref:Unannotated protein n=1 Tax=freshwater metagenome TaxID=449393 RepID=A0A6J6XDG2_9ZZZZ
MRMHSRSIMFDTKTKLNVKNPISAMSSLRLRSGTLSRPVLSSSGGFHVISPTDWKL